MKPYHQKDLGYPRTPTTAKLRVTMPDGSQWDVPAQLIADHRDAWYNARTNSCHEDTVALIHGDIDPFEIQDWAENNMNWEDVQEYAFRVPSPIPETDFQEGWVNGPKIIVGKI